MRFQDPALEDPSLLSPGSSPIAADETVMLFRAKDVLFLSVLLHYMLQLEIASADKHMIKTLDQFIRTARDWQEKNKHLVKVPDIPLSDGQVVQSLKVPQSLRDEADSFTDNIKE